jgi:RluA family pseudouridine synthase
MKQKQPWRLLYEDDALLAVDKASGIPVNGDRWTPEKTRLDTLLAAALGISRLFIVHRIDSGTSGVVVFAKRAEAHRELSSAFETRAVQKEYIAIVRGRPEWQETVCDLPLLADANKKHGTIVEKYRGKAAHTRFRLLFSAGNYSALAVFPETGRQHQIRVHLASLGHPVVCDELYGDGKPVFLSSFKRGWRGDRFEERPLLARLALHARSLEIPGPGLSFSAPLHRDMAALIAQLEKAAGAR